MTIINYEKKECEIYFHIFSLKYDLRNDRFILYLKGIPLYQISGVNYEKLRREFTTFNRDIKSLLRKSYESPI